MHTPVVVTSLHGFKSHGIWQNQFADNMTCEGIHVSSFKYGYQFLQCLVPGFKDRLIKTFYSEYSKLIHDRRHDIDINNPQKRPSIVVHSLGSYILCNAMLKHKDIKFDKIILCGSIVDENFDWDLLVKRNQVFYIRNEFSTKDEVVKWGWLLSLNNSGMSGWNGFNYNYCLFEQENFENFEHGSFFEGNHMSEFWIPFLKKEPPNFQVIRGRDIHDFDDFVKNFDQTTLIDDACYGKEPYWSELSIPDGLAEKWTEANSDIYSFLVKQDGTFEVIGYINAMPLQSETFDKILTGKLHDNEIMPEDILAYDESSKEIDLYIMSIALKPEFQNKHLDFREYGFVSLYNSLLDKLSRYYQESGIEVKRIAAIGWTDQGKKLCKLMGLKQTGILEEKSNKPIYFFDIDKKKSTKNIGRIKRLIDLYNK